MNCDDMEEALSAYADEELDGSEAGAVEAHLRACRGCRKALADIGRMKQAAASMTAPALPKDVRGKILEEARRLDRRASSGEALGLSWRRVVSPIGAAVSALALAALVMAYRVTREELDSVPIDAVLAAHGAYAESVSAVAPGPEEEDDAEAM